MPGQSYRTPSPEQAPPSQGQGWMPDMQDLFGNSFLAHMLPGITPNQGEDLSPLDLSAELGEYSDVVKSYGEFKRRDYEQMDQMKREEDAAAAAGRELSEKDRAALRINGRYQADGGATPNFQEKVDLSSPEARMKFLSNFNQNNTGDPMEEAMCAPTSVIAGMVLAKGTDGVKDLIGAMDLRDPEARKQMEELQKRIDSGEQMTQGDFAALKKNLHRHFNETMEGDDPNCVNQRGTRPETIDSFINGNAAIKETFAKHNMSINQIDMKGQGAGVLPDGRIDHAVLMVRDANDKPAMVYDPYARSSMTTDRDGMGSQITQDAQGLEDYRLQTVLWGKARKPEERAPEFNRPPQTCETQ